MQTFKYFFFTLFYCFSITIHAAPRVEIDPIVLPDEEFSSISVDEELITRKLEVTERARICKEVYLCNVTIGDNLLIMGDLSVQGNSNLNNLTITGSTNLTDLTVSGNTDLNTLTVTGDATLNNLSVLNDLSVGGNTELTDLTVTGNTLLNEGEVTGNFTVDGILSFGSFNPNSLTVTNDADIGCNLTVGCNIFTQNENGTIGGYYKNGIIWLHNFGPGNTFLGSGAGDFATFNGAQCVGIGDGTLPATNGTNNTAVGYQAGNASTTGGSNTAIGYRANAFMTAGNFNTGVGANACLNITTGINNTACGYRAIGSSGSVTGSNNTAVGSSALGLLNSTGNSNTAIGQATLPTVTTGSNNIALGQGAGNILTTGSGNIYINANAATAPEANTIRIGILQTRNFQVGIRGVTPANTDTAIVSIDSANQLGTGIIYNDANFANTTTTQGAILKNGILWLHNSGTNNLFLGLSAGNRTLSGTSNTGIGVNALQSITTGSNNTAVGFNTLSLITQGSQNVAIGQAALSNLVGILDENNNVAVGPQALSSLMQGDGNIALGSGTGNLLTLGFNNMYLGNPGALTESGIIRIGTTGGTHTDCFTAGNLIVENQVFVPNIALSAIGGVPVQILGGGGHFVAFTSSQKFKKNIAPLSDEITQKFIQLQPVSYNDINDTSDNPIAVYGFIAEDVNQTMPELVVTDQAGEPMGLRYDTMHALALKAIQNQQEQINALQMENSSINQTISDLKTVIESLIARIITLEGTLQ